MFQIVLSLVAGILIGWNFHAFYNALEPKMVSQNFILEKKPEPKVILVESATVEKITQRPVSKEPTPPVESNNSKVSPFQKLLKEGRFSDAMAFYLEAEEEQLMEYRVLLKVYFEDNATKSPKKIIEELLHYIDLEPKAEEMKIYLAQLYYDLDHYDRAIELLEEIAEESIYSLKAKKILKDIEKKQRDLQQYTHQIPLMKIDSQYSINLNINQTPLTLLLDTGASYTFIDEEKVPSLTIEKEILLNTAGGEIIAQLCQADSLTVQDIELINFKVTIAPFKQDHADGLLGMNFFEKFNFKIDQEASMLYLSEKIEK